ncbi:hypothetical protein FMM05_07620 [Flavobacterium zepuense]|uniref:Uncharacterized protein n=1 Tax=Flavobacterium zepuense TaxID=2593302 RepID=A0A552V3W9_9FLAO|nr:hypothetical protein [Flavobacterium zepuense]TRW25166.1 hypothetical protein FMM05_07620 [Flavobacterium zepuense]
MKKIFLSLAALFAFGIAQAQTTPAQEQPAKQVPSKTTEEVVQKNKKEMEIKPDAAHKNERKLDGTQTRKDEMITNDHVKSTSAPEKVTDTTQTATKKARTAKKSAVKKA